MTEERPHVLSWHDGCIVVPEQEDGGDAEGVADFKRKQRTQEFAVEEKVMTLTCWQPRGLVRMNALQGSNNEPVEFDRLWNWAFGGVDPAGANRALVPSVDVIQEENRYVVRAELPGLSPDNIEVTFQDGILALKGQKRVENEEKADRYFVRERVAGTFERSLRLPENVDADKIEARFENGVLELSVPFTPETLPRKIEFRK